MRVRVRKPPPEIQTVMSRDGEAVGIVTKVRPCALESCQGQTISMRWPDGGEGRRCSKEMSFSRERNQWTIL